LSKPNFVSGIILITIPSQTFCHRSQPYWTLQPWCENRP